MDDREDESAARNGGIRNTIVGDFHAPARVVQVGAVHYHIWHMLRPLLDRAGSNYLTEPDFQPGEDIEERRLDLAERIAGQALHNPADVRAALSRPVDADAAAPDDPRRLEEAIALLLLVEQRMSEQNIAQQAQSEVTERIAVELTELRLVVAKQLNTEPADLVGQPVSEDCPYPGLSAFTPDQAQWFFGREKLIAQLLRRLAVSHANGTPLFVVGVSGAGKSSLLQAGLVPALSGGNLPIPGSADWPHLHLRPGATPLRELVERTADRAGVPGGAALAEVREDPAAFATLLRRAALADARERKVEPGPFVLIVDQFEEIFTHCADAAERSAFVTALRAVTQHALVVFGLRADFFPSCADEPGLADILQDNQFMVGPMTTAELRSVVERPAAAVGLTVEPGLVELVLEDLGDSAGRQPGALPLLGYALRATWENRRGHTMALASYRAAGGVRQAISFAANSMFDVLSEAEQATARRLLLRLVAVGDGGEDTRRRLPKSELVGDDDTKGKVLDQLVSTRLVTVTEADVEITHEALLRAWPRLAKWLNADRAGLLVHRRLAEAVKAWEAVGRDSGSLYRGAQLADVRAWRDDAEADLGPTERDFVDASIAAEEAERELVRRRNRTLRRGLVAMACLVVLALVAGGVAVWQQQVANDQREVALSGEYATKSLSPGSTDPRRSMLLAAGAWQASPTDEARTAILSTQALPYNGTLGPVAARIWRVALSPDGTTAALAEFSGVVTLWDTASHRQLAQLTGPDGIPDVAFSPDGSTLATSNVDNQVRVWNVRTHQLVHTLPDGANRLAFDPNGRYLLVSYGSRAVLWDVDSGAAVQTYRTGDQPLLEAVAISHDGKLIAAGTDDGSVHLWDTAGGSQLAVLTGHSKMVTSVDFNRDGSRLVSGSLDGTVRLWDVAARRAASVLAPPVRGDYTLQARFSPDGTQVAAAMSEARNVQWWRVSDGAAVASFTGHTESVSTVAFSGDGHTLLSGGNDRTAMLWRIRTTFLSEPGPARAVAFSPDGHLLAASSGDLVTLWNADRRDPVRVLPGSEGNFGALAFSPDGATLATTPQNGALRLWNVGTGTAIRTIEPEPGYVDYYVTFSPDGRMLAVVAGPSPGMISTNAVTLPYRFAVQQYDSASGKLLGETRYVVTDAGKDPYPNSQAVFTPDGSLLAVPLTNGVIDLRRARTTDAAGQLTGHQGAAIGLAFTKDGALLASGGSDRTVQLWDFVAREPIGDPLAGHNGPVRGLAFLPDGRTLASVGDNDSAVRLWDVSGHKALGWIQGAGATLSGIAAQPGTGLLATAAANNSVDIWQADFDTVLNQVCTTLRGQQSVADAWVAIGEDSGQAPRCE